LCSARDAEFLITCSTAEVEAKYAESLVPYHVYSLLEVFEDEHDRDLRLVKIRNPHTRLKWQGAWSSESDNWTLDLRDRLGCPQGSNTGGVFWMSLSDFMARFVHCTICRIRSLDSWHEVRLPLDLPSCQVPCRGFTIEASDITECCLSLAQPEERLRRGPYHGDLPEHMTTIGFVLMHERNGRLMEANCCASLRRSGLVSEDTFLEGKGRYVVVPLGLNDAPEALPLAFTCVSSQIVTIQERMFSQEQARAAWVAFTKIQDPEGVSFHGATLRMAKGDGGFLVAVAENRGSGHFCVELTITSQVLRFSRGLPATMDWLPPGCGQIVQVALPEGGNSPISWHHNHVFRMRSPAPSGVLAHSPAFPLNVAGLHATYRLTD